MPRVIETNRSHRYGRPFRVLGFTGRIHGAWDSSVLTGRLTPLIRSGFQAVPALCRSDDREVFRLRIEDRDVYLKHYRFVTLKQVLQTLFRSNKAQKAYRIANILLQKGIHTPEPMLFLKRRIAFFGYEYILVTEGIDEGLSLREHVKNRLGTGNDTGHHHKRLLLKKTAEFLGRLHLGGIYHGDFTSNNIFVGTSPSGDGMRIYLIDLDSIRSTRWISSRRRFKNLDELGRNFRDLRVITTRDRARFLCAYMAVFTKETRSFKTLFRQVLARTRKRLGIHGQEWIR